MLSKKRLARFNETSARQRAIETAAEVAEVYADKVGLGEEDIETIAGDLLCDLMHWMTKHGIDPDEHWQRSRDLHFKAEIDMECTECKEKFGSEDSGWEPLTDSCVGIEEGVARGKGLCPSCVAKREKKPKTRRSRSTAKG